MRTYPALLAAVLWLFSTAALYAGTDEDEDEPQDLGDVELEGTVNFERYVAELQNFERLREISRQHMIDLHELVMALPGVMGTDEEGATRHEIRKRLLDERRVRHAVIERVDRILGIEPVDTSDDVILARLNDTTLGKVAWDDRRLIDIMKDIEKTAGVTIRLHPRVGRYNGVTLDMPNPTCATILDFICQGLEYKWLVFEGRIYILRQISRTEERFIKYENRHGKIDYWKDEPANLEKVKDGRRVQMGVYDLNTDLLRQNLLKFFMLAEESRLHNFRLKEQAFLKKFEEGGMTGAALEARLRKRERTIRHFLNVEKEASIETLDIISRILGDRKRLEDQSSEWQRHLAKPVGPINWKNLPLREALQELGAQLDFEVSVEIPVKYKPFITLYTDKVNLYTALRLIRDLQPITWEYRDGKAFFVWGG